MVCSECFLSLSKGRIKNVHKEKSLSEEKRELFQERKGKKVNVFENSQEYIPIITPEKSPKYIPIITPDKNIPGFIEL